MFNGKCHYKSPFSIAMLNYQRITLAGKKQPKKTQERSLLPPRSLRTCSSQVLRPFSGAMKKWRPWPGQHLEGATSVFGIAKSVKINI